MDNLVKEVLTYRLEDKEAVDEVASRRLYLNDNIDENVIDYIVYNILRYNREDRDKPIKDRKPIRLYINTCGGDVCCGFGVIDAILQSQTPVYTINQAACYSMGFLIFLSGSKRYSMEHSTFLCHDGMTGALDSTAKVKDRIEFEAGQMEESVREYILDRTSITHDLYKEKYRTEWYMYSQEAKELGVVTDIVGEDCTLDAIL